jgi:formylglycine-generating enzyme required for sulfatase activity
MPHWKSLGLLCTVASIASAMPASAGDQVDSTSTLNSDQARDAVTPAASQASATFGATGELRDIPQGPQLVEIPAGEFMMGSPPQEAGRGTFEDPQHHVVIEHPFAIGKYDVTFEQWDACVTDGGCAGYLPDDDGWGRGSHPVVNVSWYDAQAYADWLRRKTGKAYRLPSESEWEYVARAGTATAYWWGSEASHEFANYGTDNCCSGLAVGRDLWVTTSPVGSFPANAFGVFGMNGNAMQYVQDCWHPTYNGAPADGSVWDKTDCGMRVLRGGAWNSIPAFIRSADRVWMLPSARFNLVSFRVARSLP